MHGRERLRKWMQEHNRNQQWVADRIGIGQPDVSSYLRGRRMPIDLAIVIRKLTGIPIEAWAERASLRPGKAA